MPAGSSTRPTSSEFPRYEFCCVTTSPKTPSGLFQARPGKVTRQA
ncbi:hypothetical protein I545_3631 [Mycobacterium kansasii 662]|nr:hypothetical protein I545_3631 [Mycobacterium kansasii 662]